MAASSTLRITWRNLGRNRRRTLMALAAIAIAEWVLVVYQGLFAGYEDYLVQAITGPLTGHVQVHAPKWREDRALDRVLSHAEQKLAAIRAVPAVKSATARVYAPVLVARGTDAQAAMVVGVDLRAEQSSGLLEGVALAKWPGPRELVLGEGMARVLDARPGDELAVVGQAADGSVASGLYRVASVAGTQVDLVNRMGVVMGLDDARELLAMADSAHELMVVGVDPQGAAGLAQALERLDALSGEEVLPWRKLAPELASILDVMWAFEYFVLLLVFVAAAAGAANTMMMATFERTRELGMVLALGARPRRIIALVLTEGVLLGLLGLAVGGALGLALVAYTHVNGLDLSAFTGKGNESISFVGLQWSMVVHPRVDPAGLMRSLIAVLVTSLIAALWPAVRAARLEPVEAMRR